ncbi:zinc ribbon domain-containing protein [Microcoleus anatoxicus]|uniref:zinc ribbon domain-containing protein n=1 Tax=Microcoleus anatoxicus TaxID=2705319 RepID=UPI003BF5E0B5
MLPCKSCSNCGHIQDMPLKERTYNCGSCGHAMDRDLNAAINIKSGSIGIIQNSILSLCVLCVLERLNHLTM